MKKHADGSFEENEMQRYYAEMENRRRSGCKEGPVYSIDITGIPKEFINSAKRKFNAYLWGHDVAKNSSLQPDEEQVLTSLNIKKEDSVWEPACGSGRILRRLIELSGNVVGSDVEEEIIQRIKADSRLKDVEIINDDLLYTRLPENHFEFITAFENILGNFHDDEDRKRALINMVVRLKKGGVCALAYRTMNGKSVVQYDPLPADPRLFGIWHAFAHDEMKCLAEHCCEAASARIDSVMHTPYTRPIGGTMSYLFIKRV